MIHGYLVGDFDLFNVADLEVIAQAAQQCDSLTVGILSDQDFERIHGHAPIVPLDERREIVAALRGVASVRTFVGWSDHAEFDAVFEDVRPAGPASPYRNVPGPVIALAAPQGSESGVLRLHLGRRRQIAEAS